MSEPKPPTKQVLGRLPMELERELRHVLIEKDLTFNAWLRTQVEQLVHRERKARAGSAPHWLPRLTAAPTAAEAEAPSPDPEPRHHAHA